MVAGWQAETPTPETEAIRRVKVTHHATGAPIPGLGQEVTSDPWQTRNSWGHAGAAATSGPAPASTAPVDLGWSQGWSHADPT